MTAFISGALFGCGLLLSGMSDPRNVLAFLDVFGAWSPRLMFVMGSAIAAHAPAYFWVRRSSKPWLATRFAIPTTKDIDLELISGAALFGVGWGVSGFCPGPSIVALASGGTGVIVFVLALASGSWLAQAFRPSRDPIHAV
ncbi:MAG TPA: DUF6691 family protein [Polyangiales bacterium]|nr:DUF6691 family protein [Polyangiales bacterium]